MTDGLDFLVDKQDWTKHRLAAAPLPELKDGQVLLCVDRFAFTANNVTYAVAGDMLGYWRFFPAPEGWGRLPVMGFGDVVRSAHRGVAEGTRCFGFYPMSRHLVIEPSQVGPGSIIDGAAHRQGLAAAYSQYTPIERDALYEPEHEDRLMLLRGLFLTSFLADDFFAAQDYKGATSVLISSASSKTSIALGHQVSKRGVAAAIGLTSARNLDFVRGLGCYDSVYTYDEVRALDARTPAIFVDMAGDAAVRRAVHEHFGAQLRHSCIIGATHWQAEPDGAPLPGPQPEFFFAPTQIEKRVADWGAAGFQQRVAEAWRDFRAFSSNWLEVQRGYGPEDVARVYEQTLAGKVPPSHGHVLSLWSES